MSDFTAYLCTFWLFVTACMCTDEISTAIERAAETNLQYTCQP